MPHDMKTIRFTETSTDLSADQLTGFFVGWPKPPTPDTHLAILNAAAKVVVAIDSETNRVVGFINAISDGILSAYIPLLEVLPEFKDRGIGRELVRRMLTQLDGLYMIDLTCDKELQPFYEKFDLIKMSGMMKRNFDKQAGH